MCSYGRASSGSHPEISIRGHRRTTRRSGLALIRRRMVENPDRFNNIYLSLSDFRWTRDESVPTGQVLFTAATDGRMIGCNKLLLSDDLARIESLYVRPRTAPRGSAAGEFIGQWLVDDG